MTTVGVEEEYLLLDPESGLPVPLADKVRATAGLGRLVVDDEVQQELLQAQVEVATPVCGTLEEVGGHLLRLRHAVAAAAETHGCRIAACATPPLRHGDPVAVTDEARYRAMLVQAPQLVAEQQVNGMHVHVAVPDRETALQVVNRVRGWLPTLTALSANSPLWDGRDTGFASWRTVIFSRWPVSGMPPYFPEIADYDRRVRDLLDSGVISDPGQLYWQARLSSRYPTIEVRCLDVQLHADDAVMLAGLVRALVDTAQAEVTAGTPAPRTAPELLLASMWHAARHGLGGTLIDPEGRSRKAGDVLHELIRHVTPALDAAGDTRQVTGLLHRLLREGNGADLQRATLAEAGPRAVARLVMARSATP
ncbi:glutamate--cysteine ligase [Streptomyces durbertensis]|uniref:Putative glutamate--cysteine ligase 2 n=1 Tax=Streptomyces durbertensis TaxID=2448886 RepID=A0ABR6ELG1_9ACTN|nr:glutamate--cysteine ligase [Streptomyces durbertensis]MBB1246172.1 glutamate--cysteine ligase [Streptomyces durbertensis]